MGERERHDPGTFSWTDLSTPDAQTSKAFYGGLFGWEFKDEPIPGGGVYVMARLGGARGRRDVRDDRAPSGLGLVQTVENVDALTARAGELGANVLAEPFDVMDVGRMSTIQDPTGVALCLWQPRKSIGAEVVNRHGALSLNQLNTSDPETAQRFYSELFGWRMEQVSGTETPPYWGIYRGERVNGGMMELPEGSPAPSHWLVYFGIDDIDSAAERIAATGATVMVPPQPVPGGRIVVAQDPQGAIFALFAGRFDD